MAIECLRDWFRERLDLPDGQLAAIAAVQTFGDYLVFHPHAHVLPALFRWAQEDDSESIDASHVPWQAPELPLDDERILVLDGDPGPPDEFCGS